MASLRYLHVDVFTENKFEGNQLAVFVDGSGLTTEQMQTLTREMNFSESTFILPPEVEGTDVRMRIFTPSTELPMAGHPTIGSTFALAEVGVILRGQKKFVFGLGVGPTPVELTWKGGELSFAWMDQRRPQFREPAVPVAEIVRAAGVDRGSVDATHLPVQEISCGVPFLFVPVATRAAVDAAEPDAAAMRRLRSAFGGDHIGVFLFSPEPVDPSVVAYSRMFGAGLGVAEDPATGGATGPLGCYIVTHGLAPADRWQDMVSLQGVKMLRPSRLHMRITRDESRAISRVQVGGASVIVGEGVVEI
jgi:trans-2,3-dihydro-3-hydroxyanthranilate isomerase